MTQLADIAYLRGLLERLEYHWRRVDAPVSKLLRPGLAETDLDRLTEPLGLVLPVEARALLTWHDGTTIGPGTRHDMGPAFLFAPLARLVTVCQERREFAARLLKAHVTGLWEDNWFPIMNGLISSADIVIDTAVPAGARAPVGYSDNEGSIPPNPDVSFTDIVQMWVRCFDEGIYDWQPTEQKWHKPTPYPLSLPRELSKFYI